MHPAPDHSHPSKSRLPVLVGLVALLFLLAPYLIYPQYVSDDALLYGFDSGQSHLARFRILGHALQAEGRLPLWQVTSYGGGPFHANIENPTLFPLAILSAAILPPLLAMNVVILLNMGIAGLGMFLFMLRLLRRVGASEAAGFSGALVAGVFFGFNHYLRMESFNLVTYASTHALIPWVFLAAEGVLHGPRSRRAAGALAIATALMVFAGGTYVMAYALLGLAIWCLVDASLGSADTRRRALLWLPCAAVAAALMMAAKGLPFMDWVTTTNRGGALSAEVATGVTLAGNAIFDGERLSSSLLVYTNGGLLLGAAALCLLRPRRTITWLALGLALLGMAAASGLVHENLLAHIPPFDRIRGAKRAWTLANLFLPVCAGLGVHALICRLPLSGPSTSWPARLAWWIGPLICLVTLPALLRTDRFQGEIDQPYSYEQVVGWHENWAQASEQAGPDARVMSWSVSSAGTRNEQFIASALGAETPAGFFGFAYPTAIARHVYDNLGPIAPEVRLKRLRALSVQQLVAVMQALDAPEWAGRHVRPFPRGIDGTTVIQPAGIRPRALLPAAVIALRGDVDEQVLYTLYDAPGHRPEQVAVVSFDGSESADDVAAADALVIVDGAGEEHASGFDPPAVRRVTLPLDEEQRAMLADFARALSAEADPAPADPTPRFTREDTHTSRIELPDAPGERYLVVSELWALHGGWVVRAGERELPLHRADGVASAVRLRPGETVVEARYEPPVVRRGFQLGAVGLLLALCMLCWPVRAGRAARDPQRSPIR